MASIPKEVAVKRLNKISGLVVDDDYGSIIYVDADCGHCGSRYKVGELTVENDGVSAEKLESLIEEYENK